MVEPDAEAEKGYRNVNGRAAYNNGHIPSAGFADLMNDLSDTKREIEFTVPSPEQFCAAMGALGVGDDSRVVLYDGMGRPGLVDVAMGRVRQRCDP